MKMKIPRYSLKKLGYQLLGVSVLCFLGQIQYSGHATDFNLLRKLNQNFDSPASDSKPSPITKQPKGLDVRNLDLPYDAGGDAKEEEEAPAIIFFYSMLMEGDCFVWTVDQSDSMLGEDKMENLKKEMSKSLSELSSQSQFGLFAFSTVKNTEFNGKRPLQAIKDNVGQGISWTRGLLPLPYSKTNMLEGITEALKIAEQCSSERRTVIVVSDGVPNVPHAEETLAGVQKVNKSKIKINTVLVGFNPFDEAVQFMQDLAAQNGGQYKITNY